MYTASMYLSDLFGIPRSRGRDCYHPGMKCGTRGHGLFAGHGYCRRCSKCN